MRLDPRLPALSSLLGQRPAQEIKCPAVGKRFMSPLISARMTWALKSLTGDGGQQQDRCAKGLDVGADLPINRVDGGIEDLDVLQVQAKQEAVVDGSPVRARLRAAPRAGP
jgi:hypothetical protein